MPTISIRIDPKLKRKMDSFKHFNWSEVIRQAIKNKINAEREKNLAKAVLLNEQVRKKAPKDFNTTDIIRIFREERH